MHSRRFLDPDDFRFTGPSGPCELDDVIPDRSPADRVVIVAPSPAHDLGSTAGLILALTRAFYHRAEAGDSDFYDYPSHFVVGGRAGAEPRLLHTGAAEPWSAAWCHLDVWPNTHHAVADPSGFVLLQAVYMLEPNVLLWPEGIALPEHYAPPENPVHPDQSDMERLLHRRLRQVLLYSPGDSDQADDAWRVEVGGGALDLVSRAIERLPAGLRPEVELVSKTVFRSVPVAEFLRI